MTRVMKNSKQRREFKQVFNSPLIQVFGDLNGIESLKGEYPVKLFQEKIALELALFCTVRSN